MMNPPTGTLNRMMATRSRALNSQNLRLEGHGHCRQWNFWSAKYSQNEGIIPRNRMARNHSRRETRIAFVQVHSNSLTKVWKRSTCGAARSFKPFGTNRTASFIQDASRGPSRADYIGGLPAASNNRRTGPFPPIAGGL